MKRASKQDCIEVVLIKIRPGCNARINAEEPRCGDGIGVAVDRDDSMSIPRQLRRQLARSTTDLKDTWAFSGKESFDEIVSVARFETHIACPQLAACASLLKIYLSLANPSFLKLHSSSNLVVTGGAGFIGSNLTLALQERFPKARLTVIDDFRSGDFKNLIGYRGDFVAQNLAALDWREKFGDEKFDAIFHLASITDTTNHDQLEQVRDNVESLRRILNFARPTKTRIIYASSASIYGAVTQASAESNGAAPANAYSFSKAIMDNVARRAATESRDWIIVGLRYFNVYGPREAHKGVPASMVYHLAQQMKAGQRPRIFKYGEQKRDFVYVKDAVEGSIRALDAQISGIYNLGSGQARSFNELVGVLNKCLGTNFQPDYIDNPHAHYQNFTQADLTNARSALRYEPQFPLEDGVRDYMQWLFGSQAS
jgi:ADP-L-glycero-D-manno-heptose 6-epimerase